MATPELDPDFFEGFRVDYENPRSISEGLMLANGSKDYKLLEEIYGELSEREMISINENGVEYYDGKKYGNTYFNFPDNNFAGIKDEGDFGEFGGLGNFVDSILDGAGK